jgi:hypothetical protein
MTPNAVAHPQRAAMPMKRSYAFQVLIKISEVGFRVIYLARREFRSRQD